ncbi:TniQ family protein [Francisellaceae bacterium]|nr:TniQ family protein [Francisellaceae bacterium]
MQKWPIHPLPLSNESLSNWLHRIAAEYSVPINDLLSLSLGWNDGIDSIEINPSDNVIQNISKKSGQKLSVLRNMTMAYLAPWIVDSLKIDNNDFVTYVNQFPVLLSKGVDDTFASENWVPWNLNNPLSRVCPICIEENNGEIKSGWRYSFLLTCNIHSFRLKKAGIIKGKFKFNIIEEEVAITDSLLEMDRKSWQALDTGEVILKNRKVNCAIWFRVLRRIVHELSISPSRCGLKQSEIIKKYGMTHHIKKSQYYLGGSHLRI